MSRSRCFRRLAVVLMLFLPSAVGGLGCGESPIGASATPASGPHGGALVALPGDQGFAEILIEPVSGKGAAAKERVVAYFLDKSLQAPLGSAPSEVTVKLRQPDGDPLDASLSPEAKSGDAMSAGRFASKPGGFAVDRPIGEITATVGGQSFTGSFAASR